MKRLMFVLVAVAAMAVATTPQTPFQESLFYGQGNVSDAEELPPQAPQKNEFTFVRLIYNSRHQGYMRNDEEYAKSWYTDYPKGDAHLVKTYVRLTRADTAPESRALPILHPDLADYLFVYLSEAGQMVLSQAEAERLRGHLQRGGLLMVDDFWGKNEWDAFEVEMKKIFPDQEIVDIPRDHPIFHSVFNVEELVQVPNTGWPGRYDNPATFEKDGFVPRAKGIFNEDGRLMVFINWNTDLMDGSEGYDDPRYPARFSMHSFRMFVNAQVYAFTH